MPDHPATFIHLGLSKTATTTLQTQLFENHSQLHYFGTFTNGGVHKPVREAFLAKKVKVIKTDADPILEKSISEQLAFAEEHNLTPLLSQEGLSNGTPERKHKQAQQLRKIFGPCKAILVVREPASFIQSYYTQQLMSFNTRQFGQSACWTAQIGKPPRYFDINQWLEVCWNPKNPPQKILSTADTADIYSDVFGKENVSVFIFEELVRNPEAFITHFCDCLNIDAAEGLRLVSGKRENDRITTDIIERIKRLEKSPLQRIRFRHASRQKQWDMLIPNRDCTERFRPELSNDWKKTVQDFCRDQNRRLAEGWNLPLADYGYEL